MVNLSQAKFLAIKRTSSSRRFKLHPTFIGYMDQDNLDKPGFKSGKGDPYLIRVRRYPGNRLEKPILITIMPFVTSELNKK